MRGCRPVSILAVAAFASAAALTAGCAPRPSAPAHARPAPKNPDLGDVLERFYEDIEGRHWDVAYAMLSPRLRAALPEPAFEARYAAFADADVNVGQPAGLRAVVRLDDARSHASAVERVTLAWNGEDWTVDRLDRVRDSHGG